MYGQSDADDAFEEAQNSLTKFEGYARESDALRNFLERQAVGRARRNASKRSLTLRPSYPSGSNSTRKTRWNGSTSLDRDETKKDSAEASPEARRKSFPLAENMHLITMDRVDSVGLRPEIEAALVGFKSRFSSRMASCQTTTKMMTELKDVTLATQEEEKAKEEEEEAKRIKKQIEIPTTPHMSLSEYARASELKHIQKIRSASRARELRKQALELRGYVDNTPKRRSKRETRKGSKKIDTKGDWNSSVTLPEERTKLHVPHNTVLDPDFYDRFSHRPERVARMNVKFDREDVKQEVSSVLEHFDLSSPRSRGGTQRNPSPSSRRRSWIGGAEAKVMERNVKAQDFAREVKGLVQVSEKKDRRAVRLDNQGMSYNNTREHESIRGAERFDASHLFGMVEKNAALHSDTVTADEMSRPLRHDFRESAIPDGSGLRAYHDDYDMAVEYMGRTWRQRLQSHEFESKMLRKELQSHGSSLSEAGLVAVKKEKRRRAREQKEIARQRAMVEKVSEDDYLRDTHSSELHRHHKNPRAGRSNKHTKTPPSSHFVALQNVCLKTLRAEAVKSDGSVDMECLRQNMIDFGIDEDRLPESDEDKEALSGIMKSIALAMAKDYIYREDRHEKNVHDLS